MSGRILIVDSVATNRIVLKVKMGAARYAVDTCGNRAEAEALIEANRPDLILMNLSDPIEDKHAFCTALSTNPETADIAIIAVGVADTSRARFAALDAGASDVLPHPTNDSLLLARIRNLLRIRHVASEIWMREDTGRALGFDEKATGFTHARRLAFVTNDASCSAELVAKMNLAAPQGVSVQNSDGLLDVDDATAAPDLYVIDATTLDVANGALFRMLADLRSRATSRLAAQLVIVPKGTDDIAAMALDLGADDVVFAHVAANELNLRTRALLGRKGHQDRMRDTVRNGLEAAVTDPLTGLYNRRYAAPYVARLAEQSNLVGQEYAIMMLDIDHFKSVNDTYGHAAGDRVLVEIARRLRTNLRGIDLLARFGGEEFLIAMPQTNAEQAHAAADRLRRTVNGKPFDLGEGAPRLGVTVSVGVAMGGADLLESPAIEHMCTQADAALYAAKSAGRNQVIFARTAA